MNVIESVTFPLNIDEFTLGRVVWLKPHLRTKPIDHAPGHVIGFDINDFNEVTVRVQRTYSEVWTFHPANLRFFP